MNKWFSYNLVAHKTTDNPISNCFKELSVKEEDQHLFNYNFFSKTIYYEIYKYLDKKLFGRVLSIGSGKGFLEYHLKNKNKSKNIIATDINKDFIKFNKKIKIKYFNILTTKNLNIKKIGKFDTIYIPGIIYIFNDTQVKQMFRNIKKMSKENTRIIIFFRSKDSLLVNFIENFIVPLELKIKKIIFFKKNKNLKIYKSHKGYRRTLSEVKNLIYQSKYEINSFVMRDFESEYNRSIIVKKLKLSKLLSFLFLKQHSYLNIFELSNIKNER